jgi:hypothetical protein
MKKLESPINLKTPCFKPKLLINDESVIFIIDVSPTLMTPALNELILSKVQYYITN